MVFLGRVRRHTAGGRRLPDWVVKNVRDGLAVSN